MFKSLMPRMTRYIDEGRVHKANAKIDSEKKASFIRLMPRTTRHREGGNVQKVNAKIDSIQRRSPGS